MISIRRAPRREVLAVLAAAMLVTLTSPIAAYGESTVSDRFRAPLTDALRAIAMTPADLSFRLDNVDRDRFRLSRMDSCFRDPVGGVDRVAAMSEQTKTVANPAELVDRAATWLDMPLPPSDFRPVTGATRIEWIGRSIERLALATAEAEAMLDRAFARLTPAERDSLRIWALDVFTKTSEQEPSGVPNIYAMRRREFAALQEDRRRLALAARVDRALILRATRHVAAAAWDTREALAALSASERGRLGEVLARGPWRLLRTPDGRSLAAPKRVRIGTRAADGFDDAASVIIDPGGDDEYRMPVRPDGVRRVRVVIDAAGNDRYEGVAAAGVFGIGIVIDLAGDDLWRGREWTQGVGCFGAGIIWDEAGRDMYRAARIGQGVGAFGLGAIVDLAGDDIYRLGSYGQALGATAGVGIIEDRSGSDTYSAGGGDVDVLRYEDHNLTMSQGVGLGIRPVASGGIGLLADRRGNDAYSADIFGQAVGYWLGIGALVDEVGHDRYTAYQYAQGSGVHLAAGYLIDRTGHDLYASNGVSQGCGHDLAVGILYDEAGDDSYVAEGLSQGAGNANGISLLVDMSGADGYLARREDALGYSDRRRDYGMAGIVLDLGGRDRYGAPFGADGDWWTHSWYGIGVDREWSTDSPLPRQPDYGRGRAPDDIRTELKADPDSLFVQASNPIAAFLYLIDPAEEALVGRGGELVDLWARKLATESARERHALIRIHQKLFARNDTSDVPMLVDSLRSTFASSRRMAAYLLGYAPVRKASMPLAGALVHPDWKTREAAAISLWRLGRTHGPDPVVEAALAGALGDSVALVRHSAAVALEGWASGRSDSALIRVLADPSQIVRHSAERAIAARVAAGKGPVDRLRALVERDTTVAAMHAIRALRADSTRHGEIFPAFVSALGTDRPWPVRAEAALALGEWRMTDALDALRAARRDAGHPYLAARLDRAIAAVEEESRRPPAGEKTAGGRVDAE